MLEDLKSGWTNADHASAVARKEWKELPLFSELEHPAVQICQEYDSSVASDRYSIHRSATKAAGFKVVEARDKSVGPGWRTAIVKYLDENWAVFADTHNNFHRSAPVQFKNKGRSAVMPTQGDVDIRKFKLAQQGTRDEVNFWRAGLVRATLSVFAQAWRSKRFSASISLPEPPAHLLPDGVRVLGATLDIELLRDGDDGCSVEAFVPPGDDMFVEVILALSPPLHVSDPISDSLLVTVLPAITRQEDRWTRNANYSKDNGQLLCNAILTFAEVERLLFASEVEGELIDGIPEPQPTSVCHYVNGSSIVDSVVNKTPMRSACGMWLVSSQNPAGMDVCEKCIEELPDFSAVKDLLRQRIDRV